MMPTSTAKPTLATVLTVVLILSVPASSLSIDEATLMDFKGVYSLAQNTTTLEHKCVNHNEFTGNCTCPEGTIASAHLEMIGTDGHINKIGYCVDASMEPKFFGGAFQTLSDSSCLTSNLYTKDCSCPSAFWKLSTEVRIENNGNSQLSDLTFCVPQNNRTIHGVYEGMFISEYECKRSDPNIISKPGKCHCPRDTPKVNPWSVSFTDKFNEPANLGFCFSNCNHHYNNAQSCEKVPYCTMCEGSCTHTRNCCRSDVGSTYCPSENNKCCAAQGLQPSCCGGAVDVCNLKTATCGCPAPNQTCTSEMGAGCCPPSATCCFDGDGDASCCPEGFTCCGGNTSMNSCCNDKFEYCTSISSVWICALNLTRKNV